MSYCVPNHLSHKLEFRLNRLPTKMSDRTRWQFMLPGLVFGALLFALGLFELLSGFEYTNANVAEIVPQSDVSQYKPLLSPDIFDIVFMLIGLGMMTAAVFSYIRYRKFIFDGKTMIIGDRPVIGKKRIVQESIKNYLGVRFRIELFQTGFINGNRYIIELYHKNPERIVPLYISTSPKDVRRLWKEYARYFELPALINTDEGLTARDIKNLDKSVKEMAKLGYVTDDYDSYADLPESLKYVRRKDKIVIKRQNVWDIYNIMGWAGIAVVGVVLAIATSQIKSGLEANSYTFYFLYSAAILLLAAALLLMFRKEKLVLKKNKIVHTHKYMTYSTKHNEIFKDDIESIDVTQNPASGRYFVSIISEDRTITFGAKLPIEDLRWIKSFLIHEVIK